MLLFPFLLPESKPRNISMTPPHPHTPSTGRGSQSALTKIPWHWQSGGAGFFLAFNCNKVFSDSLPLTSPSLNSPAAFPELAGAVTHGLRNTHGGKEALLNEELVVKSSPGGNCKEQGDPGGSYRGWETWKCS